MNSKMVAVTTAVKKLGSKGTEMEVNSILNSSILNGEEKLVAVAMLAVDGDSYPDSTIKGSRLKETLEGFGLETKEERGEVRKMLISRMKELKKELSDRDLFEIEDQIINKTGGNKMKKTDWMLTVNNVLIGATEKEAKKDIEGIYRKLSKTIDTAGLYSFQELNDATGDGTMSARVGVDQKYTILPAFFDFDLMSKKQKDTKTIGEETIKYNSRKENVSNYNGLEKSSVTTKKRDKKIDLKPEKADNRFAVTAYKGQDEGTYFKYKNTKTKAELIVKNGEFVSLAGLIGLCSKNLSEEQKGYINEFFTDIINDEVYSKINFFLTQKEVDGVIKTNIESANNFVQVDEGFRIINTKEFFETTRALLLDQMCSEDKTLKGKISLESYLKGTDTLAVESTSNLHKNTVFKYIGDTDTLLNKGFVETMKELLTGYTLVKGWENYLLEGDAYTMKAEERDEDSKMVSGSGSSGVEFLGYLNQENIKMEQLFNTPFILMKGNRISVIKGCLFAHGLNKVLKGSFDQKLICTIFRNSFGDEAVGDVSNVVNFGRMAFKTAVELLPNSLKGKNLGKNFMLKTSAGGVKCMSLVQNGFKIEIIGADKPEIIANLISFYDGKLMAEWREMESKGEYAIMQALQPAYNNFFKTGEYNHAVEKEIVEEFIKNGKQEFNKATFRITLPSGEVVEEKLEFVVAPVSVHNEKDNFNATSSLVGTFNGTLQGALTDFVQLAKIYGVEKAKEIVIKNNFVSARNFKQVLLAAGLDYKKMSWTKAPKTTKVFVDHASFDDAKDGVDYDKLIASVLATVTATTESSEADFIYSYRHDVKKHYKGNGLMVQKDRLMVLTDDEEGMPVLVKKDSPILTTAEVNENFDPSEIADFLLDNKVMKDIVEALSTGASIRDNSAEAVRLLEGIKVIPLSGSKKRIDQVKWIAVAPTSSKIVSHVPVETMAALRIWNRLNNSNSIATINELISDISYKEIAEKVFKRNKTLFNEIPKSKVDTYKENFVKERLIESEGKYYRADKGVEEDFFDARREFNRIFSDLRKQLTSKNAKKYFSKKVKRGWTQVIVHNKKELVVYANAKDFKKLSKAGLIANSRDGKDIIAIKRFPETMIGRINLEIKIDNNVPSGVVMIPDFVLMQCMGDTDGDCVMLLKPLVNMLDSSELTNTVKNLNKIYGFYKEGFDMKKSFKKLSKVLGNGIDVNKIFRDFRVGLGLNESTEAVTGQIVSWDTKVSNALLSLDLVSLDDFIAAKQMLGAYVGQISIAAKNNSDVEALISFKQALTTFLVKGGDEDIVTVMDAVKLDSITRG